GGVVLGINYLVQGSIEQALVKPLSPLPMWGLALLLLLGYFVLARMGRVFFAKADVHRFEREVEVFIGDKSIKVSGFVDTGNRLACGDQPIGVINLQTILPLLDKDTEQAVRLGRLESNQKRASSIKTIEIDTLSGHDQMMVIKTQKIVVYCNENTNIFKEMMLGVSKKQINEYDMLLPPFVLA
ncbi:MAG: sigma-E processing peptidase SpoIIGA, partial [Firmicutes bacterium]|nr:sigma-E processing peptidase SpoIIGA [Bacillota bacterium]